MKIDAKTPARTRTAPGAFLRARLSVRHSTAILQRLLPGLRLFSVGLLLSAPSVGGVPLPLGACLSAAVPFGLSAAFAGIGAGLGYLLFFPLQLSLEPAALTLLIVIGMGLFHATPLPRPLLTGALVSVVGAVFLLETGLGAFTLWHYTLKILLAVAAPRLLGSALSDRLPAGRLLTGGAMLAGLSQVIPPFGALAAVAAAFCVLCSGAELRAVLACGIALDLAGRLAFPVTGVLALSALLLRPIPLRLGYRAGLAVSVLFLWQLFSGEVRISLLLCASLGAAAAALVPAVSDTGSPESGQASRLRRCAAVFAELHRSIQGLPAAAGGTEIAEVYDFAAEQVCRHCANSDLCWEQDAERTYLDLCAAAEPVMRRGMALREDLPQSFLARCRHTEGFLTALNRRLDESLSRRQLRNRRQEYRRILADQYLFVSRYLRTLADALYDTSPQPPLFRPEIAVCSAGKSGVSGDRGATLYDSSGSFCVLLCDGMGTGAAARAESDRAVRTLTTLLDAGVAPDAALGLLNDFYVLQENACFSTVDLLRADLRAGTAVLYKWGAAPSYCRRGDVVRTIGTASPPPGCEPNRAAEQHPVSLRDGETLILVTDGAFGEETEARIADFHGNSVKELAERIIDGADSEDDRTAVVLRLRRI